MVKMNQKLVDRNITGNIDKKSKSKIVIKEEEKGKGNKTNLPNIPTEELKTSNMTKNIVNNKNRDPKSKRFSLGANLYSHQQSLFENQDYTSELNSGVFTKNNLALFNKISLTIAVIAFVVFNYQMLVDFFTRSNPDINTHTETLDDYPAFTEDTPIVPVAYRIAAANGTTLNIPEVVSLHLAHYTYTTENNIQQSKRLLLNNTLCDEKILGFNHSLISMNPSNYFCLNLNLNSKEQFSIDTSSSEGEREREELGFYGFWGTDEFAYLRLSVYHCEPGKTAWNDPEIKCLDLEEQRKIISQVIYFEVYLPTHEIKRENTTAGLNPKLHFEYYILNLGLIKISDVSINLVELETDYGWLLEDERTENTFSFSYISTDYLLRENGLFGDFYESSIIDVSLNLKKQYTKYERKYLRIDEIIAQLGGILEAIMIVITFFTEIFEEENFFLNYMSFGLNFGFGISKEKSSVFTFDTVDSDDKYEEGDHSHDNSNSNNSNNSKGSNKSSEYSKMSKASKATKQNNKKNSTKSIRFEFPELHKEKSESKKSLPFAYIREDKVKKVSFMVPRHPRMKEEDMITEDDKRRVSSTTKHNENQVLHNMREEDRFRNRNIGVQPNNLDTILSHSSSSSLIDGKKKHKRSKRKQGNSGGIKNTEVKTQRNKGVYKKRASSLENGSSNNIHTKKLFDIQDSSFSSEDQSSINTIKLYGKVTELKDIPQKRNKRNELRVNNKYIDNTELISVSAIISNPKCSLNQSFEGNRKENGFSELTNNLTNTKDLNPSPPNILHSTESLQNDPHIFQTEEHHEETPDSSISKAQDINDDVYRRHSTVLNKINIGEDAYATKQDEFESGKANKTPNTTEELFKERLDKNIRTIKMDMINYRYSNKKDTESLSKEEQAGKRNNRMYLKLLKYQISSFLCCNKESKKKVKYYEKLKDNLQEKRLSTLSYLFGLFLLKTNTEILFSDEQMSIIKNSINNQILYNKRKVEATLFGE